MEAAVDGRREAGTDGTVVDNGAAADEAGSVADNNVMSGRAKGARRPSNEGCRGGGWWAVGGGGRWWRAAARTTNYSNYQARRGNFPSRAPPFRPVRRATSPRLSLAGWRTHGEAGGQCGLTSYCWCCRAQRAGAVRMERGPARRRRGCSLGRAAGGRPWQRGNPWVRLAAKQVAWREGRGRMLGWRAWGDCGLRAGAARAVGWRGGDESRCQAVPQSAFFFVLALPPALDAHAELPVAAMSLRLWASREPCATRPPKHDDVFAGRAWPVAAGGRAHAAPARRARRTPTAGRVAHSATLTHVLLAVGRDGVTTLVAADITQQL